MMRKGVTALCVYGQGSIVRVELCLAMCVRIPKSIIPYYVTGTHQENYAERRGSWQSRTSCANHNLYPFLNNSIF